MVNLNHQQRRQFLTFATGSPRLPLGGFKNLKPKMKIVRKNEGTWAPSGGDLSLQSSNSNRDNPNLFLPSVMTCQNFLKIPDYSSYEILKERFDVA